jgi:hypothetical protein
VLGVILAAFASLLPARAAAFERQWHAGVDLGYAVLIGQRVNHGLGGGIHLTYGLTDTFNLLGELNVSVHPSGRALLTGGGVGVGYVIDVLQWVPYVGVMAGFYDLASFAGSCGTEDAVPCHSGRLNLEVPFGLDYTVSRSFAVGVAGRYQLLLATSPVHAIGAFARVEYIWGY